MLKKRSDGRYLRVLKDAQTGKKIYFYGASEREINKKILDYTSRTENGITFADLAYEWWELNAGTLAYQSVKSYKPALNRAIDEFGARYAKEILPRDIAAFLKRLATFQKMSKKTVANQRTVLNRIFEYAVISSYIIFNPCASVPVPSAVPTEKRKAATTVDEEKVKATADIWLFPFFALHTGMRKGEILALQWQDIDFDKNVINVTKSVYHEGDRPFIKSPKTKESIRTVPLLLPLKEKLMKLKGKPTEYIISDDGAAPLTNRRYITLYDGYKRQTGIECTAHQLRHSFATIAIENGVSMKSVQEILGHRQISTTLDIYTDFREASLKEAENNLNRAFKKQNN